MHQTPWTKKASSVPSDRIRPKPPLDATSRPKGKGKGHQTQDEPTKSREVRRLESLLTALRESTEKGRRIEKDPKGGCFCLGIFLQRTWKAFLILLTARTHNLSPYVPLCTSCGFILCIINLPNFACPSCSSPLLKPTATTALIARLESERASTLASEAEARERAAEEAQKAAGAFPALSAAGLASAPTAPPITAPQAHKVLSLNSKTKKVTMSSYSPGSSRPASRGLACETEVEDEIVRIPQPPGADVVCAKRVVSAERPWENLRGDGAIYVPPARVDSGTQEMTERGQGRSIRS